MIITLEQALCNKLDFVDFEDKTILSFELDKQKIKQVLKTQGVQKVYNFDDAINFDIEIDSTSDFNPNSANLRYFNFKDLQHYNGHRVYSCILDICPKQEDEELTFFYRVKIKQEEQSYEIKRNNIQTVENFEFDTLWSEPCAVTIKQNYTLNILKTMYDFIADRNSYNKEVYSADFYTFLLPHAKELNDVYSEILKTKEMFILQKCDTNKLNEVFGYNYGFNIPFNMNTEEYRRMLMELRQSYLNAGTFTSIANVLHYFIGEEVNYLDYRNLFPWILRNREIEAENPSYWNYKSNYYLYKEDRPDNEKTRNEIMLLSDNFVKFNFIIKSDNFYNYDIDNDSIITIINKLKPAYTKCNFTFEKQEEFNPPQFVNPLLADSNNVFLINDDTYMQF